MRTIFVAAVIAASMLFTNFASAEAQQTTHMKRPLVTVAQTPVGAPVLAVEVSGN